MIVDTIEKVAQNFLGWAFVSLGGGFVWLVRRILTNQKQIEMLQADLTAREGLRERDREDIKEVKADVKELSHDIRHLFQSHTGDH